MKNKWLTLIERRKIVKEVEKILSRYIGRPYGSADELSGYTDLMRQDVIEFFRNEPDKLQYFSDNGTTISYRLNIEGDRKIEKIKWEPARF